MTVQPRGFRAGEAPSVLIVDDDPELLVKLDGSLVRDAHENPAKQQILSSLVRLGRALGRLTLADGVEKREERDVLVKLGCDLMQGKYFDDYPN